MKLDQDDFALFGLPRRFRLDADELATQWRQLQSRVHPDRFAAEGGAAQRLAMQWAVRVNEAHGRLKDPLARASYLCELAGHPVQAREAAPVSQDLLARQMRWHETLAEASSADAVSALDDEVAAHLDAVQQAVASDLDDRHDAAAALPKLREWLFLARFRTEAERRLEALEAQAPAGLTSRSPGGNEPAVRTPPKG
jgi:molecular chaperone HscB